MTHHASNRAIIEMKHISRRHAKEYAAILGMRLSSLRYSYEPGAVSARRALRRVLGGMAIPPSVIRLGTPRIYKPNGRAKVPITHGTNGGYERCRERDGGSCAGCREAHAQYYRDSKRQAAARRYERDLAKWKTQMEATR